ncbi:CU044_5270 family protein [Actinomadura fibrosa]|uniref:CU044_5270 family protein n=1 Tax=Actinomadura fibrosa TaxID=111802 RepID=A0ABW2XDK6_9ACTN|nr:CU044_5270 family protein [Actinomadura fibrosa]
MSDVLRTLREARPAELDPAAPIDEGVRRTELARAMATPPASGSARPRSRRLPMWGAGLAGAAAAAALVVTNLPHGATTPDARRQAPSPTRTLDARTVLLAAAEKADGQTEATAAYWHRTAVSSGYFQTGPAGARYTVVVRQKDETWTPAKPGAKAVSRQQKLGARPAAPADEAAWRRAGSPTTFKLEVPVISRAGGTLNGGRALKPMEATTAPGPVRTSSSPLVDGDKVFWLGRNVTMKDLRALPSDPAKLKAALLRWYGGHDTESTSVAMGSDQWLFQVARGLVTTMPVRPEVRAGAFRMLAGLDSVRGIGRIRDAQGRAGDAIAVNEKTRVGVLRHQLIIDPSTGDALADETVLAKPITGDARPPGFMIASEAVTATEWTPTAPH